jgi:hypothetical protein
LLEGGKSMKCAIEDTGIGIRKGNLNQLFKMFGMIESSRNINKSGMFMLTFLHIYSKEVDLDFIFAKNFVN